MKLFSIGSKESHLNRPRRPKLALAGLLAGLLGVATCTALQFQAGTFEVRDVATSVDTVLAGSPTPSGAGGMLREEGRFGVDHLRPCRDGMVDVSNRGALARWYHSDVRGDACGVIWSGHAQNALYDEGESAMLDCFLRATNCPTTFYLALFKSTLAAPAETATLSSIKSGTNYERTTPPTPATRRGRPSSAPRWAGPRSR